MTIKIRNILFLRRINSKIKDTLFLANKYLLKNFLFSVRNLKNNSKHQ